jgi:hypothetical protein
MSVTDSCPCVNGIKAVEFSAGVLGQTRSLASSDRGADTIPGNMPWADLVSETTPMTALSEDSHGKHVSA